MFTRARIRLTAWYVAALALFLLALGTTVYQLEEHQLRSNIDHGLRVTADKAATEFREGGWVAAQSASYGTSYKVSWSDGSGSPEHANGNAPIRSSVLATMAHETDMRTVEVADVTQRVYSVLLRPNLVVQVARSMDPEEDALHQLLLFMLFAVVGSIAV